MNHIVCHFDIPADDINALKDFYEKLFGWKIIETPMDYWLIDTGDPDAGGGIRKKQRPDDKIDMYICVESVDGFVKKTEELGGKVIVPKQTVPGFGFLAVVSDPQGNSFGLWQTDENAKL